jgi:hypothetical protein
MPYGEIRLIPGVNTEKTPTLNEAGVSVSQLIRYKDSLIQKLGGWIKFYPFAVAGFPRDIHIWEDLAGNNHLSIGTTTQLNIITNGTLQDITPQTLTTNPTPNFSTVINTPTVTIIDPGVTNVTILDSVLFNTPIEVDGLILFGLYQIQSIVGANSYTITAASNATSGVSNAGAVPVFTTTNGSPTVSVQFTGHGLVTGGIFVFPIATTGNGVTINGSYTVTVTDANDFTILANSQATASSSFSMNGGNAQLVYYIAIGPPAVGSGYGLGGYGLGGYGTGSVGSVQTGTEITATDWTQDNFGEILLACPAGGGVYQFDPTGGFTNAGIVSTAPPFNGGIFVSVSEEILICWGSTTTPNVGSSGIQQDPLLVKWSDVGNYFQFSPLTTDQAGSFHIPTGSKIISGMAVQNQNFIWTDLDLWAMNYIGQPFIFSFNKIGAGAGAISSHSIQALRGNVYWMGPTNFYVYDGNGVHVLPCPVWDFVFQNLTSSANQFKVRSLPNTPFNEAGWAFPSASSANGECDSYVKFNVTEPGSPWDYGSLSRSAWSDQSILGPPIGASSGGIIYQHETSNDADGQPLMASFTTGYADIGPGQEYSYVDVVIPDFKYGTFDAVPNAQIQMTFNVTNYPGDTPTSYGPYVVNDNTEFITVRFRGRQMSMTVATSDLGSFWRLGHIRFRYAPSGRR